MSDDVIRWVIGAVTIPALGWAVTMIFMLRGIGARLDEHERREAERFSRIEKWLEGLPRAIEANSTAVRELTIWLKARHDSVRTTNP